MRRVRDVLVIKDVETLKAMAEPTRAAILEHLAEPQSVTQLARALDVPRTRLYHHMELLRSKGLIEVVEERRVGPMTEQLYAPAAKTFRVDQGLLTTGDLAERVDAITTLLFDTTKSDLRRSLLSGDASLERRDGLRELGVGRSIAFLTAAQAEEFIAELEALEARFDDSNRPAAEARPFALTWAVYPASRRIR
jgi:DNA-binding transcriptional ArsR family regulator